MALSTPAALTVVASGAASTLTSASYTPTANGLQIVFISATGSVNGQTLSSVSSTHTGTGSWNFIGYTPSTSSKCGAYVAWAVTGASPGSGTFTATFAAAGTDNELFVAEVTGQDATTPVDTSASVNAGLGITATTPTLTLGAAPLTGDATFVCYAGRNIGAAPGTPSGTDTFVSLASNSHASPCAAIIGAYRLTSTSTGITPSGMGTVSNAGAAIVVKAATGGSTPVTVTGSVVNVALAAPSGTVTTVSNVSVAGSVVNVALAAPSGTVATHSNVSVSGTTVNVALAAPSGTVVTHTNVAIAGTVVNIALAAPAGTVSTGSSSPANVTGTVVNVALAAPSGTVSTTSNVAVAGSVVNVALAAPSGTVTAIQGVLFAGQTASITLAAPAGAVTATTVSTSKHFTSPIYYTDKAGGGFFWGRLTQRHSKSILKNGDFYTEVLHPSDAQVAAADQCYLGGHDYIVTAEEAAALTAAGYGAGLS